MSHQHRMVSFAQNLEDVILDRVFRDQASGFYVDVGASDPVEHSITKHFYDRGWRGINVEPGEVFAKLAEARPRDRNFNVAASDRSALATWHEFPQATGSGRLDDAPPELYAAYRNEGRYARQVRTQPLHEILAECRPPTIDFLSVDVEGHERQVLTGNDWSRFRPRVALVEATLPNSQAPSHQAWEPILLKADYQYAYFDGLNRYYVRREDAALLDRFAAPPNIFDDYIQINTVALLKEIEERKNQLHSLRMDLLELVYTFREQEKVVAHYRALLEGTGGPSLKLGLGVARCLRRLGEMGQRFIKKRSETAAARNEP
jgi:FkbM family methyltransferase